MRHARGAMRSDVGRGRGRGATTSLPEVRCHARRGTGSTVDARFHTQCTGKLRSLPEYAAGLTKRPQSYAASRSRVLHTFLSHALIARPHHRSGTVCVRAGAARADRVCALGWRHHRGRRASPVLRTSGRSDCPVEPSVEPSVELVLVARLVIQLSSGSCYCGSSGFHRAHAIVVEPTGRADEPRRWPRM